MNRTHKTKFLYWDHKVCTDYLVSTANPKFSKLASKEDRNGRPPWQTALDTLLEARSRQSQTRPDWIAKHVIWRYDQRLIRKRKKLWKNESRERNFVVWTSRRHSWKKFFVNLDQNACPLNSPTVLLLFWIICRHCPRYMLLFEDRPLKGMSDILHHVGNRA